MIVSSEQTIKNQNSDFQSVPDYGRQMLSFYNDDSSPDRKGEVRFCDNHITVK